MGNRGTVLGFKRRMRTAMRTNDEAGMLNVVAELAKDPDMMGEVLSGDDLSEAMPPDNNRDIDGHHVTINVHGAGSAGGGKDAVDPPTGSPVKPAPAGGGGQPSPSAGGEQPPPWAAQLMQRVDAIEQVLAALAEGDDDQTSPNGNGTDPNSMGSDGEGGYGPADNRDPDNRFNEDRRARTGDARTVTQDSSGMRTSFVHMLSQAEILMPGIQLATFDAAAKPTTTSGAMCSFKRKTLTASYGTDKGKAAIDAVLGASKPKSFHDASFSCDSVNLTFNAAATLVGQQNSGMAHQPRFGNSGQLNGFSKGAPSIGDINKRNNDFYKGMTQRT